MGKKGFEGSERERPVFGLTAGINHTASEFTVISVNLQLIRNCRCRCVCRVRLDDNKREKVVFDEFFRLERFGDSGGVQLIALIDASISFSSGK